MHNFLSQDIERFRAQIHVRFEDACLRFFNISDAAAQQLAKVIFAGRPPSNIVAVAYWSKCVSLTKSPNEIVVVGEWTEEGGAYKFIAALFPA